MTKLAHLSDDGATIVDFPAVDPVLAAKGFTLAQCFNAAFLAKCAEVADAAEAGWTWNGTVAAAPVIPPPTAAELSAYAQAVWQAVLAKGETFNVAPSGSAAVNVLCDGTHDTIANLALLALFGQSNPTGSKTWFDNTGKTTVLTGAELVTLATLAGTWVSDTYPALAGLLGEIAAGTVATTAAIDATAWPTS